MAEEDQQNNAEQQAAIDAILQMAQMGMAQQPLPEAEPIGGSFAGPASPINPQGEFVGPYVQQTPDSIGGAYHEGDDTALLQSMNTERLARLQDALVANGIVREVIPGRIDDATIKGMGTLMALGNRQSVTWQSVLQGITRAGGLTDDATEKAAEFEPSPYMAPDYATMAQSVKSTFRDRLGRDPDEGEMAQFVAELQGWDKGNYSAQVAGQRAAHEGEGEGTTIQTVDPVARFQQRFEQVYKPELNFVRDKGRAVETREQVEASTGLLSAMSERG